MQISIRPALSSELPKTVNVYLECVKSDYHFLPQAYLDSLNPESELAECEEWLSGGNNPKAIFAALDGEYMVGYIAVSQNTGAPAGYQGEVNNLFVRKAYRGQGLGMLLLKTGLRYLHDLGYANVAVYNYHNSQSNGYYRSLGGRVVYQENQHPGGMEVLVDVFGYEIEDLLQTLEERLKKYE